MRFIASALLALLQATTPADPARHAVSMVPVDGDVRLEVLDFGGTGRPIILLAGLGNSGHVFDDFAPKLTAFGHVIAITRRGYGASSRPETGYDVMRLGEDVVTVLKTLSLAKPVLIGHSIGGQELSAIAAQHKDLVAGLVYLDAGYRYAFNANEDFQAFVKELGPPPPPPTGARAPLPMPAIERQQRPGSPETGKAIVDGGKQFSSIDAPVLAIFASPHNTGLSIPTPEFDKFDEAMTEHQAGLFEKGVKGSRVVRFPKAGHYLFITNEAETIREIAAFLQRLQ